MKNSSSAKNRKKWNWNEMDFETIFWTEKNDNKARFLKFDDGKRSNLLGRHVGGPP